MNKKAFITGMTGQDGSYLAEFLLDKGYEVHGLIRRVSQPNMPSIEALLSRDGLVCHGGDLTDTSSIQRVISSVRPCEVYNLGAQSHVGHSFVAPEYTANVDALGALRVLEAVRAADLVDECRVYQASTSELFGKVVETPQCESTPFYPVSPYAISKQFAYWMTINYREAYGLFACNGILFNHESPRRGLDFVTRKITNAMCRIAMGLQDELRLGNINALRDWGHAKDYVEMQWMMLQAETPEDYVIATGIQHTVREFVELVCSAIGIEIEWSGSGISEHAVLVTAASELPVSDQIGKKVVSIDKKYYRPAEVDNLLGNPALARKELGWVSRRDINELVAEMVEHDLDLAKKHYRLQNY